ncbi:helix-turn-helix domain-containing protein [Pseudooceanicola aestuarii]|uniref:excisionase family DNA-binding protein n=1 Tax=Pseudooceanicola aestuarii TaxID=2697319 RepID=UPI0013D838E5
MKAKLAYSPQEVAELLNVPYGTVCAEIRSGQLVARRVGKSYRIHHQALDKYLLCPDQESQRDSTVVPIRASGSSVTVAKIQEQDIAAQAAVKLLKMRSHAI